MREELSKLLTSFGFECVCIDDFKNVLETISSGKSDLVLLDINLPYVDGYHICREIRKYSNVPIIIVTSRSTDMDELMGMNLGADDFVTKPYNKQILLARIEAVLKRSNKSTQIEMLEHKGLVLFLTNNTISFNGKTQELTRNEFRILFVLIKNANRIVSRDELMDELWQTDEFVDDNTLTVNVNRLRHKLDIVGTEGYITTRRGQGYSV